MAHRLHDAIRGDEGKFVGGLVVPSQAALVRLLGVPPELVTEHTPVSAAVVEAMAQGCRAHFGTDLGLAVSQFPALAERGTTPQRLFLSLAGAHGLTTRAVPHFGSPDILKTRAAKQAMNLVRLALLEMT